MPDITELCRATTRVAWRKWLEKHHARKKDVWLVYPKKHSGKKRVPYPDAVEEALCFGWIDSTVKTLDGDHYVQRFSPRNPKSSWSQTNLERASKMIAEKKMAQAGLDKLGDALEKKSSGRYRLRMPSDLQAALHAQAPAWQRFKGFAPSYQRHYLGWLADAKRPETRIRRIAKIVAFSLERRKPGLM